MKLRRQRLPVAMLLGVAALAVGAHAQTVSPAPAPTPAAPTPTVPAPVPPAAAPPGPPSVAPVAPTPTDTDQAGIAAAYDALNAAYLRADLKAYFAWFAPDYQVTGTDGKTTDLGRVEKQVRQERGELTSFHSRWTLSALTPAVVPGGGPGEAVVITTHAAGTGQRKVLFFTARGSFVDDTQMRDLWEDTTQGWRLARRQVLSEHLQSHPE